MELLPQSEGTGHELINGELFVIRSLHCRQQQISRKVFAALDAWSDSSGLGEAILAPGIMLLDTDTVIPDGVLIGKQRLG
ncbi:hypothetical protein [Leptothoe sp. PORK10 BA2]|uniref:hypothetical protein n=1 Tax=Leptothoe sp. PORK10 BA2 TaxID=3110254 RepID=UPI002B219301|nr:hypothetical protein [Leptothoe sp. PORK10 BA2]MEA5466153.1 hypothetical protein [Leptothoe sp. PORK10 BA2]